MVRVGMNREKKKNNSAILPTATTHDSNNRASSSSCCCGGGSCFQTLLIIILLLFFVSHFVEIDDNVGIMPGAGVQFKKPQNPYEIVNQTHHDIASRLNVLQESLETVRAIFAKATETIQATKEEEAQLEEMLTQIQNKQTELQDKYQGIVNAAIQKEQHQDKQTLEGALAALVERNERPSSFPANSCRWQPDNPGPCSDFLQERLPPVRRWIFLGDAHLHKLVEVGKFQHYFIEEGIRKMNNYCKGRYSCEAQKAQSPCGLSQFYDLPPLPPGRERAEPYPAGGVGPRGAAAPDCQEHPTALSWYPVCRVELSYRTSSDKCRTAVHGGFVAVEYAKDVEVQTEAEATTQANLAGVLGEAWNKPELEEEMGKPICVVGNGMNDMVLEGMTVKQYIENVVDMLNRFGPQCAHFVWVTNRRGGYETVGGAPAPKMDRIDQWNWAIRMFLSSSEMYLKAVTILDVEASSIPWHKEHGWEAEKFAGWYERLARFFVSVAGALVQEGDEE